MAELVPYPLPALIRRIFRELDASESIFGLHASKWFGGSESHDLSVAFGPHVAPSPLGPAAGPQSQLAQNIVLCWLGGCRVIELKTVQIIDTLEIPRPCIDMQTIGYNVEWSQELSLTESLDEYVKASMLIDILVASGRIPLKAGYETCIFDMSVGYDLEGIRSPTVLNFIRGMKDASEVIERLRPQIPEPWQAYRTLNFRSKLSDTLTLSTFHGCPPQEIEGIVDFLLRDMGLHCIVKLNPTLLGPKETRRLLHDVMGYDELHIPDSAFENDTRWDQMVSFMERLSLSAESLGLELGVKFTNTLLVRNHRDFFPADQKEMYVSGPPLHVLAMNLVGRFRAHFGDRFAISFSAGIDRQNFADAVALGLSPVTVCSDLLKPGGYGRLHRYFGALARRMDKVGAKDVDEWILKAYGQGIRTLDRLGLAHTDPRLEACKEALTAGACLREAAGEVLWPQWVSATRLANTAHYVTQVTADVKYTLSKNSKAPRKIGSELTLFNCITCDKCIPVCPNDANFALAIPPSTIPSLKLERRDEGWETVHSEEILLDQRHQIANFADFCNECGNCDIFCPEDGGPYVVKPRFFGSEESWTQLSDYDGFCFDGPEHMRGRFGDQEFLVVRDGDGGVLYESAQFSVRFDPSALLDSLNGDAKHGTLIDFTYYFIMQRIRDAIFSDGQVNYVSCLSCP